MNQCPFLSSVEEKIPCFKECAFYEYETISEGCPFRKVKGHKSLNIKEFLNFDIESKNDDDYFDDVFIKEYM